MGGCIGGFVLGSISVTKTRGKGDSAQCADRAMTPGIGDWSNWSLRETELSRWGLLVSWRDGTLRWETGNGRICTRSPPRGR